MFESYLAPAAGITPDRDLASAEIWEVSLRRSQRRRELAAAHRRGAPRTRGATAAVSAALLVSPLLASAPASARAAAVATSASSVSSAQPRPRHRDGAILERGDKGAAVAKIQRALGISADGVYGPRTERAVKRFQGRSGLTRSGDVDGPTWLALLRAAITAAGSGAGQSGAPGASGGTQSTSPAQSGGAAPVPATPATPATPAAPASPATPATGACSATIAAPLHGTETSPFGDGRHHEGVDLADPVGTAVRAAACGIVTQAGVESGYGNIICIRHSTAFSTCYAHLSTMVVAPGAFVGTGQLIGRVGMTGHTTGPHLHFETRVNGRAQNPAPYLAGTRTIPGTLVTT